MFTRTSDEKTEIDEVIDTLKSSMIGMDEGTETYSNAADQFVKLWTLRASTRSKGVTADTLVVVAGNLLGILIIVGYEQRHVITTKALSLLPRVMR